jgi:hypothetical protein
VGERLLDDGRERQDAANALELALTRYERKEILVMAERARARLVELQRSETAAERA